MWKIFLFVLLFFGIYSLTNGKTIAKQRNEQPNNDGQQNWKSQYKTTHGIELEHGSATRIRQNEFQDFPAIFEEDPSMKSIRKGDGITSVEDMSFALSRFLSEKEKSEAGTRFSSENPRLLAPYSLKGTEYNRKENDLVDDLEIKKRFDGYRRKIVLQKVQNYFTRRYGGYFDSLASSIL